MSNTLDPQTCATSMLSAADSPVRTSAVQAKELAWQVLAAAYGSNSCESSQSFSRPSSWSKMSPAERVLGSTPCAQAWESKATRAYRSHLRRLISEHHINALVFSSLRPTLTRTANMLAPSMQKWRAHRNLRPTLTAAAYGSNQGGAAGRTGKKRVSLDTLAGAPLSPRWCEWWMSFPKDWTRLVPAVLRSETQ